MMLGSNKTGVTVRRIWKSGRRTSLWSFCPSLHHPCHSQWSMQWSLSLW